MSTTVSLLICSVLLAATVKGKSFQNLDGFDAPRSSAQHTNIIGFNNRNSPMPHSVNNFNPLSSSLVSSSQPVFRPMHSNRNTFPHSFGRPLPISHSPVRRVPRIPVTQSHGISFGNGGQAGGPLNAGAISFGGPVRTPVSFSNKPTQTVLPSQPTNSPGVALSFGGGPVIFPSPSPSVSNKPVSTNIPNFSQANSGSRAPQPTPVHLDPSPTKGDPSIFFPGAARDPAGGSSVINSDIPNPNEDSNCRLKDGTIYFNGHCQVLLARGACPEDHWLLLDVTGSPYCAERQCPWGQLKYLGDCVDPGDHQVCNRGQILYVDFTGSVECDCEPDFVFDSVSNNCYGIHEQGFCDDSLYLERDQEGNMVCVPNPCASDIFVQQHGVCYEKNYRGYCPKNQVLILPQLSTADCLFIVPHSIFEVPTLSSCPPGSRRDFFRRCRGVFRIPSQSSFPTLKGDCPTSFVKDPAGTCRKVINLFG